MVVHSTLSQWSHPSQQTHNPRLSAYAAPHLGQIALSDSICFWCAGQLQFGKLFHNLHVSSRYTYFLFICFPHWACLSTLIPFSFGSAFVPFLSFSVQLTILFLYSFHFLCFLLFSTSAFLYSFLFSSPKISSSVIHKALHFKEGLHLYSLPFRVDVVEWEPRPVHQHLRFWCYLNFVDQS